MSIFGHEFIKLFCSQVNFFVGFLIAFLSAFSIKSAQMNDKLLIN